MHKSIIVERKVGIPQILETNNIESPLHRTIKGPRSGDSLLRSFTVKHAMKITGQSSSTACRLWPGRSSEAHDHISQTTLGEK